MLKNRKNLLAVSVAFTSLLVVYALVPGCASRALAPLTHGSGDAPPATSNPVSANPVVTETLLAPEQNTLAQSIQDDLTGLSLETPDNQDRLRREAREFVQFHKGTLSSARRRQLLQACQEDEPRDAFQAVFCQLKLKSLKGSRKVTHPNGVAKTTRGKLRALTKALEKGDLAPLATATDSDVIDALKKVTHAAHLRPIIDQVLNSPKCVSSALLTGLGLKTEEYFPDSAFKTLAQALYQRSSDCGNSAAAVKGAYRLGLIQVWDQKYAMAETSFAKIIDNPESNDFRSRVLYWRYFCAKQLGNLALQESMKAALAKEHPLSLHGLITLGGSATDHKPRVAFRSNLKPGLDAKVRVAEALQAAGASDASVEVLAPILEQLPSAEPEFQLYVGLLLKRAGDSLHKFKLLSGLYRDYPGLISQESMELLFPLHRFEMVQRYEEKADPYLVTSLMRQESAFNEHAHSRVGAMGLMQLMPQTARRMERIRKNSLYDPSVNIRLGVRFFALLTNRYQGEVELALAAYNAGPDKVDTWRLRYPVENRLLFVDLIPFRETREYVASIARNYYWYKKLYPIVAAKNGLIPVVPAAATDEGKLRAPAGEKLSLFKLFET